MRIVTSRWIDLARSLTKEAEGARQDSSIVVPPSVQAILEFPSQLKRLDSPAQDIEISDSFAWQNEQSITGVGGGVTVNGPRLVAGVWHLRGHYRFQFIGTSNIGNASFIRLQQQNAAGSVDFFLGRAFHLNPTSLVLLIDHLISISDKEGNTYSLDHQLGATVAADNAVSAVSLIASRIL